MKTDDLITVQLRRGDALSVGQTLRSLARSKLGSRPAMPPDARPLFDSVGLALAMAAISAPIKTGGAK